MALCTECKSKILTPLSRLSKLNNHLHFLGMTYYDTFSAAIIDVYDALRTAGFSEPEIHYTPGQGRAHAEVGEDKWLTLTWYRMESGRYEIVAYVN